MRSKADGNLIRAGWIPVRILWWGGHLTDITFILLLRHFDGLTNELRWQRLQCALQFVCLAEVVDGTVEWQSVCVGWRVAGERTIEVQTLAGPMSG